MKENLGIADRVIRILVAVAALYFIGIISGTLGIILMIVAIVFLLTSFIKVCPAYMPFGLSTCKTEERK